MQLVVGPAFEFGEYGWYACPRGVRRSTWLVDKGFLPATDLVAGPFVAYERLECDRMLTMCRGSMRVYDARGGRVRTATTERSPSGAIGEALGLLVTSRGWAAWMRYSPTVSPALDVWVWPPGERPRVIATGTDVDGGSLAASGDRVYWTQAGQPRSAPLR